MTVKQVGFYSGEKWLCLSYFSPAKTLKKTGGDSMLILNGGKNLGRIIYSTPEQLRDLTPEQRLRVLRARAERAKEIADEKLMAFAQRTKLNNLSLIPEQL